MASEVIERCAKQILQVGGFDESEQTMAFARLYARTVMNAMREPTETMWAAGTTARLEESPSTHRVWYAMIDAALTDRES